MKKKDVLQRTYERAFREAAVIDRDYLTEGSTWRIHRGWLAGFRAGKAAGWKAAKLAHRASVPTIQARKRA